MGAIRLFLALVVATAHWQLAAPQRPLNFDGRVMLGFGSATAVLYFYVISGFLITWTLTRNYTPDVAGAGRFWRARAIRIFALYWPVAAFAWFMFPGERPTTWPDLATAIFLASADWRVAFASYPDDHWAALMPYLHQAWTLGAELAFYLAAPLLMRSWRAAAAILAASLATRGYFVATLGPQIHGTWTYYFAPTTFCFFLFGHFACRIGDAVAWLRRPALGYALLAACAVTMIPVPGGALDTPRNWVATAFFVTSLPAVFGATKDARLLNRLGDLSYPVYLSHALAFVLLGPAIAGVTSGLAGRLASYLSILIALTVAVAIGAALLPIERALRAVMAAPRRKCGLAVADQNILRRGSRQP